MVVAEIDGVEYDVTPRSLLGEASYQSAAAIIKNAPKAGETRGGITHIHGVAMENNIQESKDFGFDAYGKSSADQESAQSAADSAMERLLNTGAQQKNAKEELVAASKADAGAPGDGVSDRGAKGAGARGLTRPSDDAPLTEAQKDAPCEIFLTETPTNTLISIRGVRVMNDTEEHAKVTAENEAYDKLVESKITSDNFAQRAAQTFNFAPKNKESMAAPPATKDSSCQSSSWDIYDNMQAGKIDDNRRANDKG